MEREELIQLLRSDVEGFNRWRREHPDLELDLSGVDLQGLDLCKADLSRMSLRGACLEGCNLERAVLSNADLREANFRDARLALVTLHKSVLRGADFRGATIGPLNGDWRMCVNVTSFDNVRWSREQIEQFLELLNRNSDWTITYDIKPKQR